MNRSAIWFALVLLIVLAFFHNQFGQLRRRVDAIAAQRVATDGTGAGDTSIDAANKLAQLAFEIQRLRKEIAQPTTQASTKDLFDKVDELSSELYDFERTTQQSLRTLNQNVLRRLNELASTLAPQKLDPAKLKTELAAQGIAFEPEKERFSFTAHAIQRDRPLEVCVIADGGPGHESLLRSPIRPSFVRLALVSLGLGPGRGADMRTNQGPQGARVYVYLTWAGLEKPWKLEDALLDGRTGETMKGAKWVFAGSDFVLDFQTGREVYIPDDARVVIALTYNFSDSCVIACDQTDAGNEQIWSPNIAILPDSAETEVTVIVSAKEVPEFERPK
jgi:hypothetical protein